jgi:hypothetical protein
MRRLIIAANRFPDHDNPHTLVSDFERPLLFLFFFNVQVKSHNLDDSQLERNGVAFVCSLERSVAPSQEAMMEAMICSPTARPCTRYLCIYLRQALDYTLA